MKFNPWYLPGLSVVVTEAMTGGAELDDADW
jgi:hypothetical protein